MDDNTSAALAAAYDNAVAEFNKHLDLMESTWGYRPDVTLTPYITIGADFNIQGFAHKGKTVVLRGRRTPKQVANIIASEISQHRNTCTDCGIGVAGIWARVYAAEHPNSYQRTDDFMRMYGRWDVPADDVERKLHPRLAARLDIALRNEGVLT